MPKIIDHTEISGAPRASNQQHLSKPWKNSKISQNIYNYFHFIDILGARGVAEISDRSTIFGLWCHMNVHIKLYAYMTLIFENMIKKMIFITKMSDFHQKKNHLSDIKVFIFLILIKKSYRSWSKTWITMYMCQTWNTFIPIKKKL